MSKGGSWKPLKDGRRRCGIYECGYIEDNLCCADCPRKDCKNRCLNAPERCGQAIRPEIAADESRQQKRVETAPLEPFYTEECDARDVFTYLRKRRI